MQQRPMQTQFQALSETQYEGCWTVQQRGSHEWLERVIALPAGNPIHHRAAIASTADQPH